MVEVEGHLHDERAGFFWDLVNFTWEWQGPKGGAESTSVVVAAAIAVAVAVGVAVIARAILDKVEVIARAAIEIKVDTIVIAIL